MDSEVRMGQLGGLSALGSIAVGIAVGLLSTSVQSLGLTLQRKSHILEDEKSPHDVRRPPHRRRRWQLGMLMFIISNLVGSTIQITTLPLPVLSTLQASGLVFNSICATLILGEPFTRRSFGGTLLVCGGAVLIAVFGAVGEPAHNLDQLLLLLQRRQFAFWMAGQVVLVLAIIGGIRVFKVLNPNTTNHPRMRLPRGMAYGCISGILSAHSLLVAKSAVELLVRTVIDRVNQFNRWQSWMVLLGLVSLALSQLYYLHRGLKLCSTSVLYPFVFCVYNIIAILDGLIYFKQTSKLSALHAFLIGVGTAILLFGVLALSWRLHDDPAAIPPVVQTSFGSDDGIVNDYTERNDDNVYGSNRLDEESGSACLERQSPLRHSTADVNTLNERQNESCSVTRSGTPVLSEAQEIWGELEDDTTAFVSPSSEWDSNSTTVAIHSEVDGGVRETMSLLPAKTGRIAQHRRKGFTTLPQSTERSSLNRPKADIARRREPHVGWWKWLWWKRPSKGEGT